MDNTANRDRNRFFEDDDGLNLRMQDWIRMIMISDPGYYKEGL